MFTGIVEEMGTIQEVERRRTTRALVVEVSEAFGDDVEAGSSVAVDGACLTAVERREGALAMEVIGTTLSRTVAAGYRPGTRVNLERALRMGGRLEGHLVQGHVDGLGELLGVEQSGEFRLMDFRIPEDVYTHSILHGSIALNGVSLTVNRLRDPDRCQVGIIPHTWEHTNLRHLAPGDPVNVEGDLIGKYVGTLLRHRGEGSRPGEDEAASGG